MSKQRRMKGLLTVAALAGLSALTVFLSRTTDTPPARGEVVIAANAASPAMPDAVPSERSEPETRVVQVPEAAARAADGEVVTRCTDPEC